MKTIKNDYRAYLELWRDYPELSFIKTYSADEPCIFKYIDQFGTHIIFDECPTKSLMVKEFKLANPDIDVIEILNIFVHPEHRYNGIGSRLLKTIATMYENYAILVLVGVSEKEYPKLDEKDIPKILKDLLPFYTKNNFVNVNNIYGSYSNFIPMLYTGNEIGKNIADKLGLNSIEKKYEVECPVCKTSEFLKYDMGSHAGGGDDCIEYHHEDYLCDKCGGEFTAVYEIKDNQVLYLKIDYKSKRTDRSGFTRA